MTDTIADFHCLTERWRMRGTITTRTALRIGTNATGFDAVDLPVIKDGRGYPLIPGASIKGALRATVEALIRGSTQPDPEGARVWSCDPLATGDEQPGELACGYHEREQRPDDGTEDHCTVCQLFGSLLLASHVRFTDALLQRSQRDRALDRVPLELRDGVSIDRDLARAIDRRKYNYEVVPPGVDFALELFVDNPKPWLMGLLLMGFDQLDHGYTALGGGTSRGLGRVSLTWRELRKVCAADLLNNRPAAILADDHLADEMNAWRAALADSYRQEA